MNVVLYASKAHKIGTRHIRDMSQSIVDSAGRLRICIIDPSQFTVVLH